MSEAIGELLLRRRFSITENWRLQAGLRDEQLREKRIPDGFQGKIPNQFGMVIVLANMAEDHLIDGAIEIFRDELGSHFVREVPAAAHDALLDRPRVRPNAQHLNIMI